MNGVTLQSVSLGPVSIYYGVLNGQLVLTDSQTAIGELQSTSNRLADDDAFKAAKKASGLPRLASGVAVRRSAGHDPRRRSRSPPSRARQVPPTVEPEPGASEEPSSSTARRTAGRRTAVIFLQTK